MFLQTALLINTESGRVVLKLAESQYQEEPIFEKALGVCIPTIPWFTEELVQSKKGLDQVIGQRWPWHRDFDP